MFAEGSKVSDCQIQDGLGIIDCALDAAGEVVVAPAGRDIGGQVQPGLDLSAKGCVRESAIVPAFPNISTASFDLENKGVVLLELRIGGKGKALDVLAVKDKVDESHDGQRMVH